MRGERLPQLTPVLGEEAGVRCTVLLEEPRRALDVREEEGNGSGRQPARAHVAIIAPAASGPTADLAVTIRPGTAPRAGTVCFAESALRN